MRQLRRDCLEGAGRREWRGRKDRRQASRPLGREAAVREVPRLSPGLVLNPANPRPRGRPLAFPCRRSRVLCVPLDPRPSCRVSETPAGSAPVLPLPISPSGGWGGAASSPSLLSSSSSQEPTGGTGSDLWPSPPQSQLLGSLSFPDLF